MMYDRIKEMNDIQERGFRASFFKLKSTYRPPIRKSEKKKRIHLKVKNIDRI